MKVGDKVKVKSDLKVGYDYNGAELVEEMVQYLGKETTIAEVLYTDWSYGLNIDGNEWEWTTDMFDLIESSEEGGKVYIVYTNELRCSVVKVFNDKDKAEKFVEEGKGIYLSIIDTFRVE